MSVCALAAASCTKEASFTEETKPEAKTEMGAGEVRDGWIRIKIKEDAAPLRAGVFTRGAMESGNEDMDRIAAELGATEVRRVFSDGGRFAERRRRYGLHLWYDVRFDESVPVSRAADRFATIDGVEYIEPVYVIKSTDADAVYVPDNVIYTPSVAVTRTEMPFNDPMLSQQWHYNNEGENGFTAGADINLFEAWKVETGKPNVIVSVHDQGIVLDHEDLAAHIWVNEAEMNGAEGVDDDGNGYKDDIHGWNYINNSPDIIPEGHGTHVAGTISAVNNNGIGVCGVAGGTGEEDGVRIMSLQILYQPVAGGSSQFSERAPETYAYAADNGAVISQNSWTLGVTGKLPYSYEQAFTYFNENAGMDDTDGDGVNDVQTGPMAGGIIIFAAGNAGGPTLLPAASDKVIAVAASGPNYEKGSYSSCGPEIDILAPGGAGSQGGKGNVLSTYKDSYTGEVGYSHLWGTSMACPHVSGVVALGLSYAAQQRRHFTADEFKKLLYETATPIDEYIQGTKFYYRYAYDLGYTNPTQMMLSNYTGQMGVGQVNAKRLLDAIAQNGTPMRFPNLYIPLDGEVTTLPATFFLNGESLTYTVSIENQAVATSRTEGAKIIFSGLKEGSTKASIAASDGTTHNFNITVRKSASGSGWL